MGLKLGLATEVGLKKAKSCSELFPFALCCLTASILCAGFGAVVVHPPCQDVVERDCMHLRLPHLAR